jgi:hypothetical protein
MKAYFVVKTVYEIEVRDVAEFNELKADEENYGSIAHDRAYFDGKDISHQRKLTRNKPK